MHTLRGMTPTVVRSVLTEYEIGRAGWVMLHELASQRRRSPREQALQLIRYALCTALAGKDVEPTRTQLKALLEDSPLVA